MADRICYAICKFFFQNCIERAIIFARFTKMQKMNENIGNICIDLYISRSSDIKCILEDLDYFWVGCKIF